MENITFNTYQELAKTHNVKFSIRKIMVTGTDRIKRIECLSDEKVVFNGSDFQLEDITQYKYDNPCNYRKCTGVVYEWIYKRFVKLNICGVLVDCKQCLLMSGDIFYRVDYKNKVYFSSSIDELKTLINSRIDEFLEKYSAKADLSETPAGIFFLQKNIPLIRECDDMLDTYCRYVANAKNPFCIRETKIIPALITLYPEQKREIIANLITDNIL